MNQALFYIGALLPILWGVSHLFPTKNVVVGFGDISLDNQRIIAMEWINEGAMMIFIGVLVASVTWVDRTNPVSQTVYILSFVMLNVLSVISIFTGFRINFLPFRLCPFVFSGSSLLILAGMLM